MRCHLWSLASRVEIPHAYTIKKHHQVEARFFFSYIFRTGSNSERPHEASASTMRESRSWRRRREPIFAAKKSRGFLLSGRRRNPGIVVVGIWNCTLSETCPVFQSRKNCLATDVLKHSVEILKEKEVVRPVPAQGYTRENPEATKTFNTWNTHSKFKIAPEKWWLEDDHFLLGFGHFSGATCLGVLHPSKANMVHLKITFFKTSNSRLSGISFPKGTLFNASPQTTSQILQRSKHAFWHKESPALRPRNPSGTPTIHGTVGYLYLHFLLIPW